MKESIKFLLHVGAYPLIGVAVLIVLAGLAGIFAGQHLEGITKVVGGAVIVFWVFTFNAVGGEHKGGYVTRPHSPFEGVVGKCELCGYPKSLRNNGYCVICRKQTTTVQGAGK